MFCKTIKILLLIKKRYQEMISNKVEIMVESSKKKKKKKKGAGWIRKGDGQPLVNIINSSCSIQILRGVYF